MFFSSSFFIWTNMDQTSIYLDPGLTRTLSWFNQIDARVQDQIFRKMAALVSQ